jgi:hypothetical protein
MVLTRRTEHVAGFRRRKSGGLWPLGAGRSGEVTTAAQRARKSATRDQRLIGLPDRIDNPSSSDSKLTIQRSTSISRARQFLPLAFPGLKG